MEKYITSDKVGEFVQTLHQSGVALVSVDPHEISVRLSNKDFIFIKIYQKGSHDDLVRYVQDAEKKAQEEVSFDQLINTTTAKEA